MIMDILKKDTESIRACSLSVRTFRPVAQSFLGRHISVKDPSPLKNCVKIVKNSGFQSIRSLSLGITTKRTVPEEYWNDYLTILKAFAERRSLLRLWLWEVPLSFLQPEQKEMFVEIVLALSTSVNDLGLYGCHFSCYEEMVSLVRAFPHCERLYLQDCVTGGRGSPTNVLAELPQHRLSIVDLDLTASSRNKRLIDTSGFIEDAELDLSSLGKLACDLRSARGIRRVVSAASKSPVRDARFSSARPEGFKGTERMACLSGHITLAVLTSYFHPSIFHINITPVAFGIVDYRTYVSRSEHRVLEARTWGLPKPSSLDQNQSHLPLLYSKFIQPLLLVPPQSHALAPWHFLPPEGFRRLSDDYVAATGRHGSRFHS